MVAFLHGIFAVIFVGFVSAAGAQTSQPTDSHTELRSLRTAVDGAIESPATPTELRAIASRLQRFVEAAHDTADRTAALRLSTKLCVSSATVELDEHREFTITQLAHLAAKSPLARVLLTSQCLPPLHRADADVRRAMLERHTATVDRAVRTATDEATILDLHYLCCAPMIELSRACGDDWLSAADRARLDERLSMIERSDLPAPTDGTYRERIAAIRAELKQAACGRDVSECEATDLAGKRIRLKELRGKVVVLSFWSSWCVPCLEMIPEEAAMLKRLGPRGVALVGVNADATRQQARRTAADKGMTWPQLWSPPDQSDSLARQLCISQWPSIIVLDSTGAIRAKFVGSAYQPKLGVADVERAILEILSKP
ncbi:MAG: TlpA family protein disulfide reductase [Phycisphaerae bacterium]